MSEKTIRLNVSRYTDTLTVYIHNPDDSEWDEYEVIHDYAVEGKIEFKNNGTVLTTVKRNIKDSDGYLHDRDIESDHKAYDSDSAMELVKRYSSTEDWDYEEYEADENDLKVVEKELKEFYDVSVPIRRLHDITADMEAVVDILSSTSSQHVDKQIVDIIESVYKKLSKSKDVIGRISKIMTIKS